MAMRVLTVVALLVGMVFFVSWLQGSEMMMNWVIIPLLVFSVAHYYVMFAVAALLWGYSFYHIIFVIGWRPKPGHKWTWSLELAYWCMYLGMAAFVYGGFGMNYYHR